MGTRNTQKNILVSMSSDTNGYEDTLYYPHTSDYNNCYRFWLASPSANYANNLIYVHSNGDVDFGGPYYQICGVRPVVCLPSKVKGTKGIGGVWTIQ